MNKNLLFLGFLAVSMSSFSAYASEGERSLQCSLFEIASGKALATGGAFPRTQSGSPDEPDRKDYVMLIDRTNHGSPSLAVVNRQKKKLISATFEMGKQENSFPPFKVQLLNEREGLRLECAWQ